MVNLQSTCDQGTTDFTGIPTGAFKPISKYKKKKSRRPKFVNIKFREPIKTSSGIYFLPLNCA